MDLSLATGRPLPHPDRCVIQIYYTYLQTCISFLCEGYVGTSDHLLMLFYVKCIGHFHLAGIEKSMPILKVILAYFDLRTHYVAIA